MVTQYQYGFDPNSQYQVCTWRGFDHDARRYNHGDVVTVADIPATTLFTLYRFRSVEKVVHSVPKTQPRSTGGDDASSPSPRDRVAESLESLTAKQLKRMCEERGIDADGDKSQLRDRILAVVG